MKITRRQLRQIIKEELILCETGVGAISAQSVIDPIDKDSGRQASIDLGLLDPSVTPKQWLDLLNIMYRGRIDSFNHDWYFYMRPFFKDGTASQPTTGKQIEMMMSKLGFQTMTEADWRRFKAVQAEDTRRKPGDVMDHKGNIINLGVKQ